MNVSSDRYQKEEEQTGPHWRIRYTRAIVVARDSIGTLLQEGSLFFISLFRVHLNNTTSCCERAESREEPPARPGTREFWDRPRTRSYCYGEGGRGKRNVRKVRGTTAGSVPTTPRETMFNAIPSASPAVHTYRTSLLHEHGPLSSRRHFSNFSFRLPHVRARAVFLKWYIFRK